MADDTHSATATVPAGSRASSFFPTRADEVSGKMVLLTWTAFLIAAILLHRLAWKPLLRALDRREQGIRQALEEAERARQQTESSAELNRQAVTEAAARARALSEEARLASERAAARLEQETREKSRRMLEDADRGIVAARSRAQDELRHEAGLLAVQLSEQMLAEQLTPEQRRAYEARVIGKLPT